MAGILVLGSALGVTTGAGNCLAADVYIATTAEGAPRYATHPTDSSYQLVFEESGTTRAVQSAGRISAAARGGSAPLVELIRDIAARHQVDASLVQAMVEVESGGRPNAVSIKGAVGAMQLMPLTAQRYGITTLSSLRDPAANIDAGVRHLKDLLAQHDGNLVLALAAYNAGATAVARHGGRIPPYPETMLYVASVLAKAAPAAIR